MGLDMYLTARKFYSETRNKRAMEDGFSVESKHLEAGYWRKHPDLHGYIVEEFNNGVDDCQPIELDADCIKKIITAVNDGVLPHTVGFFFGKSFGDEKDNDIEILTKALTWLETPEKGVWKSIIYRASW